MLMLPSLSRSSVLPLSVLVSVSSHCQYMFFSVSARDHRVCRTEDQIQPSCFFCSKSHASRDNQARLGVVGAHHAELARAHEAGEVVDFLLEGRLLLVLLSVPAKISVLLVPKLLVKKPTGLRSWNRCLRSRTTFCWRVSCSAEYLRACV